ncbi:hypothetical protein ACFXHA_43425 [Nocardia sp. NPDC059240]|uniref:hypothetical protein n=1 Tax=Nocardia sp. NPDC059240 TaxID=3346786 RepID=UPI00368348FC
MIPGSINPGRPPAPEPPASAVSWPVAVLASVVVVAGLGYHYLLIMHGIAPAQATRDLLTTAVPLVALVLPASSLGTAARTLCRAAATILGKIGSGGGA